MDPLNEKNNLGRSVSKGNISFIFDFYNEAIIFA